MGGLRRFRSDFIDTHRGSGSLSEPAVAGYQQRLRLWMLRLLCECGVVLNDDFCHRRFIADTNRLMPVDGDLDDMSELLAQYSKLFEHHRNRSAPGGGAAGQEPGRSWRGAAHESG
ncbi:MAG: hypothetical protein U5L08_07665 [Xanthomonadales bacterium]|nr:hypothetical protein [Xanthomonadales bacterium]